MDNAPKRTILVVEDNSAVRDLLQVFLRQAGYRVLVAPEAFEALGVFATHRNEIDLLLTDVDMPGMNGIELAWRFRAERPLLAVILISGNFEAFAAERPPGSIAVAKPFRMTTLLGSVDMALMSIHSTVPPDRGEPCRPQT